MIDEDAPRDHKGRSRYENHRAEPPPAEPWFEGVRQCSRKAKGRPSQRCPNEALPLMKICGYHYGRQGLNAATSGVYSAMFTNPALRKRFELLHEDKGISVRSIDLTNKRCDILFSACTIAARALDREGIARALCDEAGQLNDKIAAEPYKYELRLPQADALIRYLTGEKRP